MKKLTSIGLGTFPFSNVFTKVDRDEARKIVKSFIEFGGNYIETAPLYVGVGSLLREILRDVPRDKYYISTKCVTGLDKDGQKVRSGKYQSIINQCSLELETLGVDFIDLYMMHIPPPDALPDETMQALNDLKTKGLIKNIGISNVSLEQLKSFCQYGEIRYVQNRFSLLNQSFTAEFHNYCIEHNINYIPFQVIERGLLTSQVRNLILSENDLRRQKPEFREEVFLVIRNWVYTHLKPIADEMNISVESLVILWTLQQPQIAVCSIGATKSSQIKENMKALNQPFPKEMLDKVNSAYDHLAKEVKTEYSKSIREFMGI